MRRTLVSIASVTVLLGCDSNSPKALIAAEVKKGVTAVKSKDIEGFLDQIAPEVLPPDSIAAAMTLETYRRATLAQWQGTETRSMNVTVDSVTPMGDSAIVFTTLHWDRLVAAMGGHKDTVISDVTHRELWRNTPKGWRTIRVLSLDGQNNVNGRIEKVHK
jgi:hypothetical protein